MITPRSKSRRKANTLKEQNVDFEDDELPKSEVRSSPLTFDNAVKKFGSRVAAIQKKWMKIQSEFGDFLKEKKFAATINDADYSSIQAACEKLIVLAAGTDDLKELSEFSFPSTTSRLMAKQSAVLSGLWMLVASLNLFHGNATTALRILIRPELQDLTSVKLQFIVLTLALNLGELTIYDKMAEKCRGVKYTPESYIYWLQAMDLLREAFANPSADLSDKAFKIMQQTKRLPTKTTFSTIYTKMFCQQVLIHAVKKPKADVAKTGDLLFHSCRLNANSLTVLISKVPGLFKENVPVQMLDAKQPIDILDSCLNLHMHFTFTLQLVCDLMDSGLGHDAENRLTWLLQTAFFSSSPQRVLEVANQMRLVRLSVHFGTTSSEEVTSWIKVFAPLKHLLSLEPQFAYFDSLECSEYLSGFYDFLSTSTVDQLKTDRIAMYESLKIPIEDDLSVLDPNTANNFLRLLTYHLIQNDGKIEFKVDEELKQLCSRSSIHSLAQWLLIKHYKRLQTIRSYEDQQPTQSKGLKEDPVKQSIREAYDEYRKYHHLLYSIWRQEICLFMATYLTKTKTPDVGYRVALYLTETMTVGLRAAIRRQAFENDFDAHRNAKTSGTSTYLIENAMEQMAITDETCSNFVARKAPMIGYFPNTDEFTKCVKELPTDFTIIQLTLNGQQDLFMTRIHRNHEPLTIPLGRLKVEHFDSVICKRAASKQPTTVNPQLEVDNQNPQLLGSSSSRLAAILHENERTATNKGITVKEFWTARDKLDKQLKELVDEIQVEVFGDAWPLCCTFNTQTDESMKKIQESLQKSHFSKHISFILAYLVDQLEKSDWVRIFKLLCAHDPGLSVTKWTSSLEKSIEKKYTTYRELLDKSTATEDRYVFLIVSPALTHIPWETLPVFRKQMVSRIPSFYNLHLLLQKYETVPRAVNAESSYYVLNPTGNLANTQARMEKLIERMQWDGVQGQIPSRDELLKALRSRDLYIYLGHGSGRKYIGDSSELRKILCQSVCLLMGCSSLEIRNDRQGYDGRSVVYDFISASCPCIIGCLWMATDGELDRFFIAFMEFCFEELAKAKEKFAASKTKIESDEAVDSFRFMMRGILRARNACKLPFLTGGTVISYGLPTIAGNGKPNRDVPRKQNGKFASSDVISVSTTVKSDNWETICQQYSAKKKR